MNNGLNFLTANRKEIINRIKSRQKKLRSISKELKKHFVGLDGIIDKVLSNLEVWYCMPELLTRPVIICLWGVTGVGKTDLVRRLVKLLDFQDRFCEIEMMNKGRSSTYPWHSSITSILSSNPKIESGNPCVILLDEIQNFRTINEDGHELSEYKYRDIWTLLSDGKLPFHLELDYLLQELWELTEKEKKEKESKKKVLMNKSNYKKRMLSDLNDVDDIRPYTVECKGDEYGDATDPIDDDDVENDDDDVEIQPPVHGEVHGDRQGVMAATTAEKIPDLEDNYYELKHFKAVLRLAEPLEEIATWNASKKKAVIVEKLNEQSIYEEVDYTKSLIFVSGNLDEAYEFAKKTNEVDVDADIFHKLSKKINILDIKRALIDRFKPEQVARFGNMQIIYPTPSKSSYEIIIHRKIREVIDNVKKRCGIDIEVDSSINRLIYENGVFPTQGTRPVFSTISEILESPLPPFLLTAFTKKAKHMKISYEKDSIVAQINSSTLKYPYQGSLDKLRISRNKNMDSRVLNAVHEAGHSVVYARLFHSPPPQISAYPAASEIGGFVWGHDIGGSKEMIENKICSLMGGRAAEKVVFGDQNVTWGAQDDLQEATKLAGAITKRYGMDKFSSFIQHPQRSDITNTDLNSANSVIERIVLKFATKAEDIIKKYRALFNEITDFLLEHKELPPKELKRICVKYGVKISLKKSDETLYTDYCNQYRKFKKNL